MKQLSEMTDQEVVRAAVPDAYLVRCIQHGFDVESASLGYFANGRSETKAWAAARQHPSVRAWEAAQATGQISVPQTLSETASELNERVSTELKVDYPLVWQSVVRDNWASDDMARAWGCLVAERAKLVSLRRQLAENTAEVETLTRELAAMTEDRNLWREDHGDDCPYKEQLDLLQTTAAEDRETLTRERDEARIKNAALDQGVCEWENREATSQRDTREATIRECAAIAEIHATSRRSSVFRVTHANRSRFTSLADQCDLIAVDILALLATTPETPSTPPTTQPTE